MAKVKRVSKRLLCCLLVAIMLSQTVVSEYSKGAEVEAMVGVDDLAFITLFSMLLGSMGFGMVSRQDNEKGAMAFQRWLERAKDSSSDMAQAWEEFRSMKNAKKGTILALGAYTRLIVAVQYWVKNVLKPAKGMSNVHASSSLVTFDDDYIFSCNDFLKSLYGDKAPSSITAYVGDYSYFYYNTQFALHLYCNESSLKKYLPDVYNSKESLKGKYDYFILYGHNPNQSTASNAMYHALYPVVPYTMSYGTKYSYPQYQETILKMGNAYYPYVIDSDSVNKNSFVLSIFARSSGNSKYTCVFENHSGVSIPESVFKNGDIITSVPYFDSKADLNDITDLSNSLDVKGLYGDGTATYQMPESITAGDTALTDAIADAVATAIAENNNEALTSEQINAIVNQNVIDYSAQIEALQDSIDATNANTQISNSWLSKIYSKVNDISVSLATKTDGSSALSVDDSQSFKVVEGGGKSPDPDNEDPKIWGLGAFTVVKFLQPLIEIFAEPLSELTKWQNKINKSIQKSAEQQVEQAVKQQEQNASFFKSVIEFIEEFPLEFPETITKAVQVTLGGIQTSLDTVAVTAGELAKFIESYPLDIVQYISEGVKLGMGKITIPIEVPEIGPIELPELQLGEVKIPILSDMLDLLKAILGAIQGVFVLDLDGIEDSLTKFKKKLAKKFSLDDYNGLVSQKFTNSYDYPVIKMQSPTIIKQFTDSEYVVLFNGKDFADYFVWVRGLLRAMLWVAFAYGLLRKFRVQLTMD